MPKLKIFESGDYPQGNISKTDVKTIFSKSYDNVNAIFAHSSKWKGGNKNPIRLGKFDNFELVESNNEVEVFANLELNEKGSQYRDDGIIKGISVEIDRNKLELGDIAILPIGVDPAVDGANISCEFEKVNENIYRFTTNLEFETLENMIANIDTMTIDEKMQLITKIKSTVPEEQKQAMKNLIYEYEKGDDEMSGTNEPVAKTSYSKEEFEQKLKEQKKAILEEVETQKEFEKVLGKAKEKVMPSLHPLLEYALKKASEEKSVILEFQNGDKVEKMSNFERFSKLVDTLQLPLHTESETERLEFGKEDTKELTAEERAAAYGWKK